jgi:molybdenum cofactor cytidylyltransferase
VLAHALDVASRAMQRGLLAGVTCVAPDADGAIAALARDAGAEVVVNPEPDAGLSRSVQIGLDHLATIPAAGPAAALFLLGDQPAATVETLAALIATWRSGAGPVVRPRYLEEPDVPGHPLLLDRRAWALAALLRGDEGFAPLIRSRGLPVTVVDRPGRNPDIDTRTDLALLEERH